MNLVPLVEFHHPTLIIMNDCIRLTLDQQSRGPEKQRIPLVDSVKQGVYSLNLKQIYLYNKFANFIHQNSCINLTFAKKTKNYYETMSSKRLTAASSPSLSSSTSWLHPLMSCDVLWLIVITVRELFDMSRLGNSSWTSAKINQWSYFHFQRFF